MGYTAFLQVNGKNIYGLFNTDFSRFFKLGKKREDFWGFLWYDGIAGKGQNRIP